MAGTTLGNSVKKIVIPLLIVAVALAAFIILKATKPEQPPVEVQQKVWPVQVMSLQPADLAPMVSLYGKVESNQLVNAAAPVAGVVEKVWVREGQTFQQGESLVALNPADLELPYQIAKADVADTRAQLSLQDLAYRANQERLQKEERVLQLKKNDVSRNEQLIKKDLASQATLEASKEALVRQEYVVVGARLAVQENKAKVAQLKARLEKAVANEAQAKMNWQRGVVKAPYDGRVAKVPVAEGDRVAVNAQLVSFYALDSLELRAKLPRARLEGLYQALQAGEALSADLWLQGQRYSLPLKRLAGEAQTSGLDAFFAMPAELTLARPGDLYRVALKAQVVKKGYALPYSALYGSDRIYVVEQGVLRAVQVEPMGETQVNGEMWMIVKADLPPATQVVTTHLPNAISGLSVKVVE